MDPRSLHADAPEHRCLVQKVVVRVGKVETGVEQENVAGKGGATS